MKEIYTEKGYGTTEISAATSVVARYSYKIAALLHLFYW
jgi:hypothetical protein